MSKPQVVDFSQLRAYAPTPGIEGRALFGNDVQMTLVSMEPNVDIPIHTHPQEQLSIVLEGVEILIVDGEEHVLTKHQGYAVPGDHPHGARTGPEGAVVLEVFTPLRNDYLAASRGETPEAFS